MTENQAPQLRLPQRPAPRAAGSGAAKLACVLLLVVIVLQGYALTRSHGENTHAGAESAAGAEPADLKAVAMKLEDRNLAAAGAEAWQQYLARCSLEPLERAKVLYRIGRLQAQSEQYEPAMASLYLAERLADGRDDRLSHQIAMQVSTCLKKLGRYSELTREMAARATPGAQDDADLSGRRVVAEIGQEQITLADFEAMLQAQVDAMISAQPGLPAGRADEFRKQALRQLSDPQARAQMLHQMIGTRVLAAEARQSKRDESPQYRERLVSFADDLLASMQMEEEIGRRAAVTPEDAERYYETNQDRYTEPAKVMLAHVLCPTEEEAEDVLAQAPTEVDFAELAEEYSLDEATQAKGGRLAQPVIKEADSIPGIGRHAELQNAIWAAEVPSVLDNVYQTDGGWHVVKVLERTEPRLRPYEEVKEQVERDVQAARQEEVTRQYLQELFERHEVRLHPENL